MSMISKVRGKLAGYDEVGAKANGASKTAAPNISLKKAAASTKKVFSEVVQRAGAHFGTAEERIYLDPAKYGYKGK